jgi:hypothetical protein
VEGGAPDLLDRTHCLKNDMPGHEWSDKVPPLNVEFAGRPTMQKVPQKVINKVLFGLADFFPQRTHRDTFVAAVVWVSGD